jgi:hypothetical protein
MMTDLPLRTAHATCPVETGAQDGDLRSSRSSGGLIGLLSVANILTLNSTPTAGFLFYERWERKSRFLDSAVSSAIANAPDDSLLLLRDMGTQEIYALDWEAP